MKGNTALLLSFGTAAVADIMQLVSTLPECTIQCISDGAAEFGCDVTDFDCLCPQLEALTAETAPCFVHAGCDMAQIAETAGIVQQICQENDEGSDLSTDNTNSTETADGPPAASATSDTVQEDASDSARRASAITVAIVAAAAVAVSI